MIAHPGVLFRVASLWEINHYGWPLQEVNGRQYRPRIAAIGDTIVLARDANGVVLYNDAEPGVGDLIRAEDKVLRCLRARSKRG